MLIGGVAVERITDDGVQVKPFQFNIVVPAPEVGLPDPAAQPWVLSMKETEFRVYPFCVANLVSVAQLSAPSFVVLTITGTGPPVEWGMKPTAHPFWVLLGSKVIDSSVMLWSTTLNGCGVKAPPVLVDRHKEVRGPDGREVPVAQASDPLLMNTEVKLQLQSDEVTVCQEFPFQ
jgi:hypothetical protein